VGLAIDLKDYNPSVLIHCWLGHLTCKIVSEMTYNVSSGTLNPTIPYHTIFANSLCISCGLSGRMSECFWVRKLLRDWSTDLVVSATTVAVIPSVWMWAQSSTVVPLGRLTHIRMADKLWRLLVDGVERGRVNFTRVVPVVGSPAHPRRPALSASSSVVPTTSFGSPCPIYNTSVIGPATHPWRATSTKILHVLLADGPSEVWRFREMSWGRQAGGRGGGRSAELLQSL